MLLQKNGFTFVIEVLASYVNFIYKVKWLNKHMFIDSS